MLTSTAHISPEAKKRGFQPLLGLEEEGIAREPKIRRRGVGPKDS